MASKKEKIKEIKKEDSNSKYMNRTAIWEVCLESGAIIGIYEGTPSNISAYVQTTRKGGGYYKKLEFRKINITKVPKEIYKTICCEKKYTSLDKFCSRCGKSLKINMKSTKSLKVSIFL